LPDILAELYDAEKNGSLDEWEKKYGRDSWTLKPLPREKDYKEWLAREGVGEVEFDRKHGVMR
jgi:hypothetical protein